MTLTADQRWLLMTIGGWQIIDALAAPAGVQNLMRSNLGGTRHQPISGAPDWMTTYEVTGNKIISPRHDPRVTVTASQINSHAQSLPADLRQQLIDLRDRTARHVIRGYNWCHCGDPEACPFKAADGKIRHHPSADETESHKDEWRQIRELEAELLRRALLDDGGDGDDDQLELFEVTA